MARPRSEGLSYFPHDVDASTDEKVESLTMLYGPKGYMFYFVLLERIYRTASQELDISDAETRQILSKKLYINPEEFQQILKTAVKVGCFDREKYEQCSVLTSNGIKKRAASINEKREKMRLSYQKRVSAEETPPETPQSKVKETKPKAKEKEIETSKASGNTQSIPVIGGDPSSHSPEIARSSSSHSASPKTEMALYFDLYELFKPHKPSDVTTLKDICRQIAKKHSNGSREAVFAEVIENALRSKEVGKRPLALFVSKMKPYGYVPLG